MKLMINMSTFEVQQVPMNEFANVVGVTNNGQHCQLEGFVLADVRVTGKDRTSISLFHPNTKPGTGHVDVFVDYKGLSQPPTFHRYGAHERFNVCDHESVQDMIWPTGGWSLIQTVVAIEGYLQNILGFTPPLRRAIYEVLAKSEAVFAS